MGHHAFGADKNNAVRLLAQPTERLFVFPGHNHRLTLAERIVLETRPVQRMSRLRQTGLAYLTIPTNENTRLTHCLGTAYWTAHFISAMRENDFAGRVGDGLDSAGGNRERLAYLDAILGPGLSLDLLARVYALVHDSDLLPFGHTLSYQLGFYLPPGNVPRFQRYLAQIAGEVVTSPALTVIENAQERAEVLACLHRHLAAVEAVAVSVSLLTGVAVEHSSQTLAEVAALLPVYTFIESLVTATVSTDLLDFALRDTLGAGTPWQFDAELSRFACAFAAQPTDGEASLLRVAAGQAGGPPPFLLRFGVNAIVGGRLAHRAISYLCDLLRVRYEVLERIVYSPGKCAADAMLDRGIRNVNAHHAGEPFSEAELLALGDDQFLDLVDAEEHKVNLPPGCAPVTGELKARRLWPEAYRLDDKSRLSARGAGLLGKARDPIERDVIEERLLKELPDVSPSDIVVSCLPLTMQTKDPDTLVGWRDSTVLPLGELAASTGHGADALAITRQYPSLWSLSVYTRNPARARIDAVRKAAMTIFES